MFKGAAIVTSTDDDFIKLELGSEFADMIFHQLLRYQAQIIFQAMESALTDIYESPMDCGRWDDLQKDMKRIEAVNVLLEYYGQPLIDLPAEMERRAK